jgi:hypothetical protein
VAVIESPPLEDLIHTLTTKINQLKREFDQYFLGTRPREPVLLRGEVQKLMAQLSNQPIQNTALRFKFSSLCSKYQAHKRQWDETLRKIEAGTYERHRFKADLHARQRSASATPAPPRHSDAPGEDLFAAYRDARLACGQSTRGLSRERLEQSLERQRDQLRQRFGADADFQFRVAVENGQVRLKAKRVG